MNRKKAPALGGPQFTDPGQVRTAAQGVQTMVQHVPDVNAGYRYNELSKALGIAHKGLQQYQSAKEKQDAIKEKEAQEEAQRQATLDYGQYGKDLGKMQRAGFITPHENPAYMERISELRGKAVGQDYHEFIQARYAQWQDKGEGDITSFIEDSKREFMGANPDLSDAEAFHSLNQMSQYEHNLAVKHAQYKVQYTEDKHADGLYGAVDSAIQDALQDTDGNPEEVWGNVTSELQDQLQASYDVGLSADAGKKAVVEAIINAAEENHTPDLVGIAKNITDPSTGKSLWDDPDLKSVLLKNQEAIGDQAIRHERLMQEKADREKKETVDNITRDLSMALLNDPDADIRQLVEQGTQVDPDFLQKATALQRAAEGTGTDDPQTFAKLRSMAQKGNLPRDAVYNLNDIRNINTLMSLQQRAEERAAKAKEAGIDYDKEVSSVKKQIDDFMVANDGALDPAMAMLIGRNFEDDAYEFISGEGAELTGRALRRGLEDILQENLKRSEALASDFKAAGQEIGDPTVTTDIEVGGAEGSTLQIRADVAQVIPEEMYENITPEAPWATEVIFNTPQLNDFIGRMQEGQFTSSQLSFLTKNNLLARNKFQAFIQAQTLLNKGQ